MFIIQKFLERKKLRDLLVRQESEMISEDKEDEEILDKMSKKSEVSLASRKQSQHSTRSRELSLTRPTEIDQIRVQFTEKEIRALRVTWRHCKGSNAGIHKSSRLMLKVFEKATNKSKALNMIFHNAAFFRGAKREAGSSGATIYDHAKYLSDLIDLIINSWCTLKSQEQLLPSHLGEVHATCLRQVGFTPELWEVFGQSFAKVMAAQDFVRAYPYASRAWNILIAVITDRSRASFEQTVKREKQKVEEKRKQFRKWSKSSPAFDLSMLTEELVESPHSTPNPRRHSSLCRRLPLTPDHTPFVSRRSPPIDDLSSSRPRSRSTLELPCNNLGGLSASCGDNIDQADFLYADADFQSPISDICILIPSRHYSCKS